MSLVGQINLLATRIATEFKTVRSQFGVQTMQRARLRRAAAFSFPAAATTYIPWDTLDEDTSSLYSSGDPTKLTIPTGGDGTYRVTARVNITNASGMGMLVVVRSGSVSSSNVLDRNNMDSSSSSPTAFSGSTEVDMVAGDYLQLGFYAAVATTAYVGAASYYPEIIIERVPKGQVVAATAAAQRPVGEITMFGGVTVPANWLLCDGSAISRTVFASLFTALSFTTTGSTTSGSTSISVASTSGFKVGMPISGPGIPAGTTIDTYVDGGTTALLTQAATATGAVTFTLAPYGTGDGSTTFNLPSFNSAFPRGNALGLGGGADSHAHTDGTLTAASHTHDDGTLTVASHTHTSAAHVHAMGAHTHDLSVSNTGGGGTTQRVNAASTGGMLSAVNTGSTTPGATGAAAPAVIGTTDATAPDVTGTTDTSSNVPVYTGVKFMIRAA